VCVMLVDEIFGRYAQKIPLDEQVALQLLVDENGFESLADVAFCFADRSEAFAAGIPHAWSLARRIARVDTAGITAVLRAVRQRPLAAAVAPPAVPLAACLRRAAPTAPRASRRAPQRAHASAAARSRKQASPQVKIAKPQWLIRSEAEDLAERSQAAVRLVTLSLAWRTDVKPAQHARAVHPDGPLVRRLLRFEAACLRRGERVWHAWSLACTGSDVSPTEAATCPFAIDSFVRSQGDKPTSAARVWGTLAWLRKHAGAPFQLLDSFKPERAPCTAALTDAQQATVMEPGMLASLGQLFAASTDPGERTAVALAQLMFSGWVRFKHLTRAFPIERTSSLCWFRCFRGKSDRGPFDFCAPRLSGSASAADHLWDLWHQLADAEVAAGRPPPLGFGLLSTGQFNRYLRRILGPLLLEQDEVRLISSYGLRRAGPTLAECIHLPWPEQLIAGGWSARKSPPKDGANTMPLRYCGARRETQAFFRTALLAERGSGGDQLHRASCHLGKAQIVVGQLRGRRRSRVPSLESTRRAGSAFGQQGEGAPPARAHPCEPAPRPVFGFPQGHPDAGASSAHA
jgi:hypothetical protein